MTQEQLERLYQALDSVCKAYRVEVSIMGGGELKVREMSLGEDMGLKASMHCIVRVDHDD